MVFSIQYLSRGRETQTLIMQNTFVLEYYNLCAETYDASRFCNSYGQYIDYLERRILDQWLALPENSVVADFGCGTGRFLDRAGIGIDGSQNMLAVASKKYPTRKLVHSELTNIPLENDCLDAGLCFHVLMHMEKERIQNFFIEAARVIKPNGILIFDIASAPRRALLNRKTSGWHGATSFAMADLKMMFDDRWQLNRWCGIVMIPIHRVPSLFRPFFKKIDEWLGKTFLARYASYYIVELKLVA